MNILYTEAHPHQTSLNACLKSHAVKYLRDKGYPVVENDLYANQFNAVATWDDFSLAEQNQTQYFMAQAQAYKEKHLSKDIQIEINKLSTADLLILQFPLWWFSTPAIMKGWLDRILTKGFAYDSGKIFSNAFLRNKKVSFIVTTQSKEEDYQKTGIHGATITDFLLPLAHTFKFVGMQILPAYAIHDAMNIDVAKLQTHLANLERHLSSIVDERA